MLMKSKVVMTVVFLTLLLLFPFNGLSGKSSEITFTSTSQEAVMLFEAGLEAYDMGRIKDANFYFFRALSKDNQFAMVYLYKAYASNTAEEMAVNLEKAERYAAKCTEGEKIMIQIACTYRDDNPERRFLLAERLVALYPESIRSLLLLANEYQARGKTGKFRDLAYEAIRIEPDSPLGYRALAASWLLNEPTDNSLAQKYIRNFTELRPQEASAFVALGDVFRVNLSLENAHDAYSYAKELDPESITASAKLGYVEMYLGMFDEARDNLKVTFGNSGRSKMEPEINWGIVSYLYPGNGIIVNHHQIPASGRKTRRTSRIPMENPSDNSYFCCTFVSMLYGFYVPPSIDPGNTFQCLQMQLDHESRLPDKKTVEADIAFVSAVRAIQRMDFEQAQQDALNYAQIMNPELSPSKNESHNFLMGLIHFKTEHYYKAMDCFLKSAKDNLCIKFNMALTYDKLHKWEEAEKMFKEVAACRSANAPDAIMVKLANDWLNSFEDEKTNIKKNHNGTLAKY